MADGTHTGRQGQALGWLFEPLITLPHVVGVVLASQDGLMMAYAGLDDDQKTAETKADRVAAVISGMHGVAHGVAELDGSTGRDLEQVLLKHRTFSLIVMRAGRGVPAEVSLSPDSDPSRVEAVLGVWIKSEADEGSVAYEMVQTIRRLGERLSTPARGSGALAGAGQ
ncbi:roadblock/LC7 domain-containing protein [Streptomyces sp. NPDC046909]|uniref:roadblock/LC7 domain-containing protein n=1 Tax=Streptomyces sp. NPDC046909 TaxID=3155617 RepID=UPI0033C7D9AD